MSQHPDWQVPAPTEETKPTPDTRKPGEVTVPEDPEQTPLPEDAPGGRDSTIFSPAFEFVEWRSYLAQSGEQSPDLEVQSVWKNDEWPKSPCFPVREKWVYLFRQYRGEFDLAAECYIDSEGLIHTSDLESAKTLEAGDRPKPAAGNRQACLAHTINGKPAYYSGYASRVRMPIDALNALLADKGILLNALDLRALDYESGSLDKVSADRLFLHEGQWRFGVVDPLTVASDLGRRYRIARSELVAFFAPPTTDHSDEERRKIYERESKYLIGKVLAQIIEKDPHDSNKLDALIKPTAGERGVEVITKYVRTHESKQRALVMNADMAAALTCNWLTNGLMDIARIAHFHNMKRNGGEYLRVYGRASEQLIESDPGRALFADFLATPDHWVLPIALPKSALASNVLAAVQSSAGFAFTLGEQLAAAYLNNSPGSKIDEVAESLESLVDGKLFKTVEISFRPKLPDGRYGPKLTAQEIVVLEGGKSKLAEFFKDGSTAQKMQSRLLYTASLLSWISGIKALKDAGYEKLTPAIVLATFASTVSIVGSTIGMFFEIGPRYAAIFGVVSGVIAVATAINDLKGAAD